MIRSLLVSFGITAAVECIAAFLLGLRDKRSLLIVFLANVITNPAVVYTVTLLHLWVFPWEKAALALLEIAAVGAETLAYRRAFGKGALKLALLLNAASFAAGILIQFIIKQVL